MLSRLTESERWKRILPLIVWVLRIVVGATFIISGFAKAHDPWGFIFKIEEYLRLWDMMQPRSLVLSAATLISSVEFLLGCMLLLGCYRRSAVWLMLAMMAVMLPLTGYIYIADPVSDCGCFGDFMHISNGATFFKNILITAALAFLAVYNSRVSGLFGAYVQWLVVVITSAYILLVSFIGYNLQPLVDFRSFPVGRSLVEDDSHDSVADEEILFVYERDGEKREFPVTALPDSTWTYVERIEPRNASASSPTQFVVLDGNDDVTASVVAPEGEEILAIIPEYDRADVSYTYLLNELNAYMAYRGGSMAAIIAGGKDDVADWTDLSMADYPVYAAEGTMLKELVRGTMALVGLRDGKILWKRTAASVDPDIFETPDTFPEFETLDFDGPRTARNFTLILISVLAVLFLLDRSGRLLRWRHKIKEIQRTHRKN